MTFVEGLRWHTWHGLNTGTGSAEASRVDIVVVRGDTASYSSGLGIEENPGSRWLSKNGIMSAGGGAFLVLLW